MKKTILLLIFIISINLHAITLTVEKSEYQPNEDIQVTLTGMPGNSGDWVGIFPQGSANVWENVLTWKYDGQVTDGTHILDGVSTGEYEARVFLDNNFTVVAAVQFSVKELVYNTNITLSKTEFNTGEKIKMILSGMPGNSGDWIGIFPQGSTNIWENVLSWKYDGLVVDGNHTLDGINAGVYEARVFLNDSYTVLAVAPFTVTDIVYDVNVTTSKAEFYISEKINITLTGMPGNSGDWVGIYQKDAPSTWANTITWKYDGQVVDGTYDLDSVPQGEYEVRVFLNNSYTLLASTPFKVIVKPLITTIITDKAVYENGEDINITVTDMLGNQRDWIGIFPAEEVSSFENAYDWEWTEAINEGSILFRGLPAGDYEARAFFNNNFEEKATYAFSIIHVNKPSTMFEDAEGGISPKWTQVLGDFPPVHAGPGWNSSGLIVLNPQWKKINGDWFNNVEYHLPMDFSTQSILEMDIGGLPTYKLFETGGKRGYMPHFSIIVHTKTKNGNRYILWDSWFNHINAEPHIADYGNGNIWLLNPSPVEHVRGWYKPVDYWAHFRVDVEATLLNLEPENRLIYIEKLIVTGGFLDNIRLSSE